MNERSINIRPGIFSQGAHDIVGKINLKQMKIQKLMWYKENISFHTLKRHMVKNTPFSLYKRLKYQFFSTEYMKYKHHF